MKVSALIKKLQKMPQNLEVYSRDHDNGEHETSGYPRQVTLFDKDYVLLPQYLLRNKTEKQRYDELPNQCVIIEC